MRCDAIRWKWGSWPTPAGCGIWDASAGSLCCVLCPRGAVERECLLSCHVLIGLASPAHRPRRQPRRLHHVFTRPCSAPPAAPAPPVDARPIADCSFRRRLLVPSGPFALCAFSDWRRGRKRQSPRVHARCCLSQVGPSLSFLPPSFPPPWTQTLPH